MYLGYNTNGFADHRLADAVAVLHEIGYRSVAVTLDRHLLDPPDRRGVASCVASIRSAVASFPMRLTVETGARFILDPRCRHQPTLISTPVAARRRRLAYVNAAIDVAAAVGADSVSLWSGTPDGPAPARELFDRLAAGLQELLACAERVGVRLAFEPEPGMFIDTMNQFTRLCRMIDHPLLGLTLDVGHVHCLGDGTVQDHVRQWGRRLWNVHLDDARHGAHEHRMFGEGVVDFADVFDALRAISYSGPVHVELPRHSHEAVETARASFRFLSTFVP